jgi:hypothetical protein
MYPHQSDFPYASSLVSADTGVMFYHQFKEFPQMLELESTDHKKAVSWLTNKLNHTAKTLHFHSLDASNKKKSHMGVLFQCDWGLYIRITRGGFCLFYTIAAQPRMEALCQEMIPHIRAKKKKNGGVQLVTILEGSLDTEEIQLSKPKIDLALYYPDGFMDVHQFMLQQLNRDTGSGLFLLHGTPGTGKSTYLRYLIRSITRPVIFLTPNMAAQLDAPQLTHLLVRNRGAVVIMEDAESLLISRETHQNSAISMLLNLTDGILGDGLHFKIIATFNTQLPNIDKALLRQGRLKMQYEFKPLPAKKANQLLDSLKQDPKYHTQKPMTLADIFHVTGTRFQETKIEPPKIGFRSRPYYEDEPF